MVVRSSLTRWTIPIAKSFIRPGELRSRRPSAQADLFGEPVRSPSPAPMAAAAAPRPFPSASPIEVERVRVSTLLLLFQLSSAAGDTGVAAGLLFMDALEAWHASRIPSSSADDPPF